MSPRRLLFLPCLLLLTGCPDPGPMLPPPDSCPVPADGSIELAELGPGGKGEFRPFAPGELAKITTGSQGSDMMSVRIRLTGKDLPACVKQTMSVGTRIWPATEKVEVALKTYEQPDGSRVTRDFWFLLQPTPWFRLTAVVGNRTAEAELRGPKPASQAGPPAPPYTAVIVRDRASQQQCTGWDDGPGSELDAVAAWRDGQLLGVGKPGTAKWLEPAKTAGCGTEPGVATGAEGPPGGTQGNGFAFLLGGAVELQIGACSQPATTPLACDGQGPAVELQAGDEVDVYEQDPWHGAMGATDRQWVTGDDYELLLRPAGNGLPVHVVDAWGTGGFFAAP